jgi:hypothetical protein
MHVCLQPVNSAWAVRFRPLCHHAFKTLTDSTSANSVSGQALRFANDSSASRALVVGVAAPNTASVATGFGYRLASLPPSLNPELSSFPVGLVPRSPGLGQCVPCLAARLGAGFADFAAPAGIRHRRHEKNKKHQCSSHAGIYVLGWRNVGFFSGAFPPRYSVYSSRRASMGCRREARRAGP